MKPGRIPVPVVEPLVEPVVVTPIEPVLELPLVPELDPVPPVEPPVGPVEPAPVLPAIPPPDAVLAEPEVPVDDEAPWQAESQSAAHEVSRRERSPGSITLPNTLKEGGAARHRG